MEEVGMQVLGFMQSGLLPVVMLIIRGIVPVLALYVVWRSYTSFKKGQRRRDPVIMLTNTESGIRFPVLYWENSIGRSKSCDIVLPDATASRDHAVLMRREEGWILTDTDSKSGTLVNGNSIDGRKLVGVGDEMSFGATTLTLCNTDEAPVKRRRVFVGFSKEAASPFKLMFSAMMVHVLMGVQLLFKEGRFSLEPLIMVGAISAIGWGLYIFSMHGLHRVSFEIESVAYLLSGIGIMLMAGSGKGAFSQLGAMLIGVLLFSFMLWFLNDLERVMKWRLPIAIGAVVLFGLNLILAKPINGSRNWIIIGPFSIQPSELIKIAFIIVGASILEQLQTKKNITEFIIFAGVCMGFLIVIRDMGMAVIFFATFLIISFMRSGSIRTAVLTIAAAALGLFLFMQFKPYAAERFSGWQHVWEDINGKGFQQSRMLTYTASGGFFGMGLGEGNLSGIVASESDLVFGVLCEEQGLLLGLVVTLAIALFVMYARSDVTRSRSTFFSIASCAAAGMLLFQTCLNVFGATDILPFTGVTLPFISAGGSSLMSVWGLMAFIKASDERTYAARRLTRRQVKKEAREMNFSDISSNSHTQTKTERTQII